MDILPRPIHLHRRLTDAARQTHATNGGKAVFLSHYRSSRLGSGHPSPIFLNLSASCVPATVDWIPHSNPLVFLTNSNLHGTKALPYPRMGPAGFPAYGKNSS
jgi:hypothetical protein